MAISGDTLKNYDYFDAETGQTYTVTLAIKDLLVVRLLEQQIKLLRNLRKSDK